VPSPINNGFIEYFKTCWVVSVTLLKTCVTIGVVVIPTVIKARSIIGLLITFVITVFSINNRVFRSIF